MGYPSLPRIAAALAMATSLFAGTLQAQKKAVPPADPNLPARLSELKKFAKDRKMRQDFQAIGSIQNLAKDPAKWNPKDADKITKTLGDQGNRAKCMLKNKPLRITKKDRSARAPRSRKC